MRTWIVKALFRRIFDAIERGDASLPMKLAASKVWFKFPGDHAFAAEYTHPDDVEQWITRFGAYRPRMRIHDVAVSGPIWNTRAFVRYSDRIENPPIGGPYTNDICAFVRARWFRLTEYVVYIDTQRVAASFGNETDEARARQRMSA